MNYQEFTSDAAEQSIDEICAALEELGISGWQVENEDDFKAFLENNRQYWDYVDEELENAYRGLSRVKFWVEESDAALLAAVRQQFPGCGARHVQDSDWENNWRQYYKPMEIGRFLVIPEWECENVSGTLEEKQLFPLVLDPGLIFGTGSHPTTKMCLEALSETDCTGKKVLDLGCGSGILGIGSLILGAESCTAVDIDEKAPDVVRSNAALNGQKIDARCGDVINGRFSGFDVVTANIVADVIIALAPKVRAFMAEDAVFICSGIIDGREPEVEAALAESGLEILAHKHSDEWNCYICR